MGMISSLAGLFLDISLNSNGIAIAGLFATIGLTV